VFGHSSALGPREGEDVKCDECIAVSMGRAIPTRQFLDPLPASEFERFAIGHVCIDGSDLGGAMGERSARDRRIEGHSRQDETVTVAEGAREVLVPTSRVTVSSTCVRSRSIRSARPDGSAESPANVLTLWRSHGHGPVTVRRSFVAESTAAT